MIVVVLEGRTIRLRSAEAAALVARAIEAERGARIAGDSFVARAVEAMAKEPSRRWTVEGLARVSGLSRAAFARRFRRTTGRTPRAHLTELRLRLAGERLVATDDALAAVAAYVGYASEFAFAKAFKRRFGVPPGMFRRGTVRASGTVATRAAA